MKTLTNRPEAHSPNAFPKGIRVMMALLAGICLLFAIGSLAFGVIYIPSKHGGLVFAGVPTMLLAAAAAMLAMSALSVIVDHHDRRNNEASYSRLRRISLICVAVFALAAIVAQASMAIVGARSLPDYRGFAHDQALRIPEGTALSEPIQSLVESPGMSSLAFLSFAGLFIGALLLRFGPHTKGTLPLLLTLPAFALPGILGGLGVIHDLATGQTSNAEQVVIANRTPALFNAILLGRGLASLCLLTFVIACVTAAVLDRKRARARKAR